MCVLAVICKYVKGCVEYMCMYNIFMDKNHINIHSNNYPNNINNFTIMKKQYITSEEIILNHKSTMNTNFDSVIKHKKTRFIWFQNDDK